MEWLDPMLRDGLFIDRRDNDRLGRSPGLAMKYGLDVVSVRVKYKRCVITWVV